MRRLIVLSLVLAVAAPVAAEELVLVPQEVLDRIVDDNPNPLPANLAPHERGLPLPPLAPWRTPPSGTVHTPAEYEPCAGLLVSWQDYTAVLTAMIVPLTTGDPEAIAWVVVDGASQQASATSTLTSAGADMSQVEFITYNRDSVWMRDYGPRFIFEDGSRAMVDHAYNRPRPLDDDFPDFLSTLWGEPQYDLVLEHGGGNFHLMANGDAFMTDLILDENPGYTEQQVKDLFLAYENLDLTIYPGFPTSFDSTQHIDMWMLPVDEDEIIVGQYSSSTGQPYTITEAAVDDLEARGYTVHRTPGWNSGGTHYTYTNAVIMNDLVFMPSFGVSQDAQALATFQAAFEDKTVIQVNSAGIITAAGALHCVVMHVPAYTTSLRVSPSAGLDASGPEGGPFAPASLDYTLTNGAATLINYEVTKTASWLDVANPTGSIPAGSAATVTVSVDAVAAAALAPGAYQDTVTFTNLSDHSGDTTRPARLVVGEPAVQVSFPMDTNPGWATEGLWAFGQPTGGGGAHGGPDPAAGHTGSSVYGYNLAGDYENDLPERHLTSTAVDCSELFDVRLRFWRWLGVEQPDYDHASVRVSTNGSTWTTLWANSSEVADSSWTQVDLDLSAVADGQPTVYLRWTMGETDSDWTYCGWNLDDVEIWAVRRADAGAIFADGFETGGTGGWSSVSP